METKEQQQLQLQRQQERRLLPPARRLTSDAVSSEAIKKLPLMGNDVFL